MNYHKQINLHSKDIKIDHNLFYYTGIDGGIDEYSVLDEIDTLNDLLTNAKYHENKDLDDEYIGYLYDL